jgi:hypothetical protein
MSLAPPRRDFAPDLVAAGDRALVALGPAVGAADPEGRVEPRNRLLCAGLGQLGVLAYRALGGSLREVEVGHAGAMLSLVTKIDDQAIDALAFHGGSGADRGEVRRRTRAFLAPTLASIRDPRAAGGEPRCALAARLGAALRALAGDDPRGSARLDRVLATIAAGWEVQVEAVAVLTSHPDAVTRAEIAAVTRAISGVWLLMIARLGELPGDAARALTPAEEEGFLDWGWAIQRADALADLAKDLADGHLSSWAGRLLWERAPHAYLDAAARADAPAVYALLRAHAVDRACLPDAAEAARLASALPALGEVPELLAWIHAYLARRYLAHPLCALAAPSPSPSPAWARLFPEPRTSSCSAP